MTGDDPGGQDARGPRARGGMAPRRRAPHLRQDRLHQPGARDRERRRRRRSRGGAQLPLSVGTLDADAESVAAWLPAVARRLTGHLSFTNHAPGRDIDDDGGDEERGSLELPCLASATSVTLDLGCGLGLAVAPVGVYARLTDISLTRVLFRGPCALSDAVSSPRCSCLVKLTVRGARGLDNLTIRSDSLREMTLDKVRGLEQLAMASAALEYLSVFGCASFLIGFSRSPTSQRLR